MGILGYVYLFLAVIGLLYYALSFSISLTNRTPEKALLQGHCRTMLLLVSFIEIGIGIYIKTAKHKVFLFLQALATMLFMAVQGFYIYAYFNLDGSMAFSSQSAMDAAIVLLVLCMLLHITSLFEHRFKLEKPEESKYIDDDLGLDMDYEE
jgi:hypothetical protein